MCGTAKMTSFSDEDTDKMIEMIRQYPALFNSQLDSYKDKNLRDNIWKSIAEDLNKCDSECRKKWKLIKDSYNRYKRKLKCSIGSAARAKNSKWVLFERLSFLENTPSQRESFTNIVDDDDTNSSSQVVVDNQVDEKPSLIKDTPMEEVPIARTSTTLDTSIQKISKQSFKNFDKRAKTISKRKRTDEEFLKLLKEKHESRQLSLQVITSSQHNLQQPIDEIASFAKNIEMSLRKLSALSRSKAKSEIFSVISKYEMIDIEEGNANSLYPSSLSYTSPYSPISTASTNLERQFQNDLTDSSC